MSGQRALPDQASLRYLKVEAKRRLAAGEFGALHEAQLAVAREHGQPSWAALREAVAARDRAAGAEGHALGQLRWITGRFRDAGAPGWVSPDDEELRGHFSEQLLAQVTPAVLLARITEVAAALPADLVVFDDQPFAVQGRIAGHLVTAITEPRPPYRVISIQARRLGEQITDHRADSRVTATSGTPPEGLPALAETAAAQLGLAGLSLAGGTGTGGTGTGDTGEGIWVISTGWADLERPEPLSPGHVFPAYEITMAVTAVAVLRLVAGGGLRLDDPAARHLAAVRLADESVTVRELLAHTAGVTDPPSGLHAPAVPPMAEVTGPVLACTGRRGVPGVSLAGYAALGDLIAARAGEAYEDAVQRLVLRPLGMGGSWFPRSWPASRTPGADNPAGRPVPVGYNAEAGGTFAPQPGLVAALPAAGGLWTTAADLVRLGLGWASLLPRSLAAQALRPHAARPNGAHHGLGWIVNERLGLAGQGAGGPGTAASLLISLDGRHACAALANRQTTVEPVAAQALLLMAKSGERTRETTGRSE